MPDLWSQAAILAKIMLYIGVLGATGLAIVRIAYADLTAPIAEVLRKQMLVLAGLALLAAGAGFSLRGAALTGSADGMTDPEMLGLLWQTPVGDVLLHRLIGASVVIAGVLVERVFPRTGRWMAVVGGLLLLWSFAQIGHISSLTQTGARALLLVHLGGIAFWVGVLSPLHWLCRSSLHMSHAAQLGHQFGQAAMIIVPTLVAAGVGMGWLLLGSLAALTGTAYGLAFVTKVAVVTTVLGFAAANKLRFVPAMQTGDAKAAHHLARSIQIETGVLLAVLMVTAALTSVFTLPV